jgi:V8-like Glu-specific endopeptidase
MLPVLGLGLVVACGACAAPPEADASATAAEPIATTQQAITNGDDDDGDSAVVALLSDGKVFCTGVLLTTNVVATAAHCVSPTPPTQIYFGSDPSSKKGTFIAVASSRVHPDFDEDTLENDIAVVGLATTAPVAPLNVITRELDPSFIGRELRLVGFGATGPTQTADLHKRTGTTSILSYTNDDFRFAPGPSQTCVGDSGGPALVTVGDHEAVIGITSSGDGDCKTFGRDIRVDRFLPFIKGYAKAYSLPTGPSSVANAGCSMAAGAAGGGRSGGGVLALVLALGAVLRLRARVTSAAAARSSSTSRSRRAGGAARAASASPAPNASRRFAGSRSPRPAR